MKNTKNIALTLSVLAMSFLVGYLVFAQVWQEPSQAPPGANVPAPLNVGVIGQYKEGPLIVGANEDAADAYGFGFIVRYGNVGIRITSPDAFLHIQDAGAAAGTRFLQIGDDTFLSDIDVANTLSIRGVQNSAIATLELGSGGARISGGSTGNVGIGTTLEVAGNLSVSGDIAIAANKKYYFNGQEGSRYFYDDNANNRIGISTTLYMANQTINGIDQLNQYNDNWNLYNDGVVYAKVGLKGDAGGSKKGGYIYDRGGDNRISFDWTGSQLDVYVDNTNVGSGFQCQTVSNTTSNAESIVSCPSGYRVTGGGCDCASGDWSARHRANYPYENGWRCYIADGTQTTAYAICCR